jgi:hypothetical protein
MTPADIDRVFGRGRLRMVTGDHVEVFREQSLPGERRRYTKRFLATAAGDFSEWTEREWRILARLVGHGIKPVPDVVRFDRGAADRAALVQTYDAGVTVDHWATLLPLERDGTTLRNVFEDCAHWWALARHSLIALDAIHELRLVHLDLKADNVCIPVGPTDFDPHVRGQRLQPRFDDIALIDFAFSLVSGERLDSALPIAQQADYEYQSPRLLRALEAGRHGDLAPTRQLDWRCDLFSLAAMLWRYLPELEDTTTGAWTRPRHAKARALVRRLIEAHDAELPTQRPHAELIALAGEPLAQPELSESLRRGWTLAFDSRAVRAASPTPVTRIALPVMSPVATAVAPVVPAAASIATATARPVTLSAAAPRAAVDVALHASKPAAATPPPPGAKGPVGATAGPAPTAPRSDAANEALAVDPTDVAMRMQAHRREREGRTRRLAVASVLLAGVVVAIAATAWLEPTWRPLLGSSHVQLPGTTPTPPATPDDETTVAMAPPVAPARADAALPRAAAPEPAPAKEGVDSPSAPAPSTPDADLVTPAKAEPSRSDKVEPKPVTPSAPAIAGPAPRRSPVSALPAAANKTTKELRAGAPARGRTVEPSVAPARPAPAARNAMPFPAPSHVARNSTAAVPAARPGATPSSRTAPPVRRFASTSVRSADGSAVPWAVAGRTAPRDTLVKGSGERGALLPLSPQLASSSQARNAQAGPSSLLVGVNAGTSGSAGTTANAPNAAPGAAIAPANAVPAAPTALAVVARPTLAGDAGAPANPSTASMSSPPPGADSAPIDYAVRASDLMANQMPRLAQRAERQVARVLFVAGRAQLGAGDAEIRAAAATVGRDGGDALAGIPVSSREAQRLGDAARAEYARRGGTPEALALQARAFGADPLDVEAAGNLAFLLLRQRPAQAEAARQLALHALTLHGTRYPEGRSEDWATFAIASALAGRERDARNALLVTLALATNIERQCKAALDVYAIYGEPLRAPVDAMLQAANVSGRANGSALCEWPPHWVAGAR